jgi:hypothetical protein
MKFPAVRITPLWPAHRGFADSPPKLPIRDDVGAALREWLEYPASIGLVHESKAALFLDPWCGTLSDAPRFLLPLESSIN